MTLVTYDTLLQMLCDEFDLLIMPKKIRRTNRNIIYLIFKAIAKGLELISNIVYMLDSKFDPARCQDSDLESVAKLVGTELLQGTGSGLVVSITNTDTLSPVTLLAGNYEYIKDADTVFQANIVIDTVIEPNATFQVPFFSVNKGSFPVSEQPTIIIAREDNTSIAPELSFSCLDNTSILGSLDETAFEFRKRILTDTTRTDILRRLEGKLKNLPYIYDSTLFFNQTDSPIMVGSVSVAPYHLLITLNGFPRDEIADIIASSVIYPTTEVVGNGGVLKHRNPILANGVYDVFYKNFDFVLYTVEIQYSFDELIVLKAKIEDSINKALIGFKNPTTRNHLITEADFYTLVDTLFFPSVRVLNITLKRSGSEVPFIDCDIGSISKLDTAVLTGVTQ